jgi:hypothetical protein
VTADLVIVARNQQPKREARYPRTWLLYTLGQDPVEVHVEHDSHNTPHVLNKGAA